MKKTKIYIKYAVGSIVAMVLCFAIISTIIASKEDIEDSKVEELALSLKLVDENEASYPSIQEMEERIQAHYAAEKFTDISVKLSVFLIIAVVVSTIGLSIFKLAQNRKKFLRFLLPAGGLVLIFVLSRIFASSSMEGIHTAMEVSEGEMIKVSTLINATVVLMVISFTALGTYRIKHILTK